MMLQVLVCDATGAAVLGGWVVRRPPGPCLVEHQQPVPGVAANTETDLFNW